ncbi:MAG: NAD(P)H-hydrate dehydratase [Gammaproteobacteria bacterium]|nr:MAG: NAD(P)H-hydrate dehydratase [Gammaproteobacteria bacterium]
MNQLDDGLSLRWPRNAWTAASSRALDAAAIASGIPGEVLMARAGRAAFRELLAAWPGTERLAVICGTGNNGGDGYVIAQLAHERGVAATVYQVGDHSALKGEAAAAQASALAAGVETVVFGSQPLPTGGVLVDALLGTGLKGTVRKEYRRAIRAINQRGLPVLAVDIPSGLCADSGRVFGDAVVADLTVTFIGCKRGLLTGQAADHVGQLILDDLDVPDDVLETVPADAHCLDLDNLLQVLLPRQLTAHKGDFGHVMIIGGDAGMPGAVLLAAEAAARCGAGLVSVATRPEHVAAVAARCPSVMVHGVVSGQELEPLLERPTVLVVGPGLGTGPWGEQLLQKAAGANKPMVLDADALNILAQGRLLKDARRDNWILTPHPGEAARLLQVDTARVQDGRFGAVTLLQQRFGGAVVLKGAGSLVADGGGPVAICPYGNPGMASGGMGDVLSGVLGALLAQGVPVNAAARLGVCLHGAAADIAAADGERGLLPMDLFAELRALVNSGGSDDGALDD